MPPLRDEGVFTIAGARRKQKRKRTRIALGAAAPIHKERASSWLAKVKQHLNDMDEVAAALGVRGRLNCNAGLRSLNAAAEALGEFTADLAGATKETQAALANDFKAVVAQLHQHETAFAQQCFVQKSTHIKEEKAKAALLLAARASVTQGGCREAFRQALVALRYSVEAECAGVDGENPRKVPQQARRLLRGIIRRCGNAARPGRSFQSFATPARGGGERAPERNPNVSEEWLERLREQAGRGR